MSKSRIRRNWRFSIVANDTFHNKGEKHVFCSPCKGGKKPFLYTCMQNPHLHTVHRHLKWPLTAPVRKKMALGCEVFYYSVKCLTHGLCDFNGAVQRRLATQTVIMLTSYWQPLSEIELRRIFDVCKWLFETLKHFSRNKIFFKLRIS